MSSVTSSIGSMFYEKGQQNGGSQKKTAAQVKEENRVQSTIERTKFKAYGTKCNCPPDCACGCQEGGSCNCHHYHRGKCPKLPNPNSRAQRDQKMVRRPEMQSCRLMNAASRFGKDRKFEFHMEDEKYAQITQPRTTARNDNRLPMESNVKPLELNRKRNDFVYGVSNPVQHQGIVQIANDGPGTAYYEVHGNLNNAQLSNASVPQKYSAIAPLGDNCRSCM